MALMTRAEFSRHMGVSAASVTKWIQKGIISDCLKNNKIDSLCAEEKIMNTKTRAKSINARKNNRHNPKDEEALKRLLNDPSLAAITKVQIVKQFWQGRDAKLSYEEKRKELVHVANVKEMIEQMFRPFNRFLDDLPHKIKTKYPEVPNDAILWVEEEIQKQKANLSNFKLK